MTERERKGTVVDWLLLTDDEATSGKVIDVALPVNPHTQWCPLLDWWCTRAPLPACMVDGRAERWHPAISSHGGFQ
jgi:hypothetical protein